MNKEKYFLELIIKNINEIEKNIKEVIIFLELAIETSDNILLQDTIIEIKKIEGTNIAS